MRVNGELQDPYQFNDWQGVPHTASDGHGGVAVIQSSATPETHTDLPTGDAFDAELPDGTRVVSTSTTVNGQTTVTADLLDKDGHVLLHAGAGQTMERDPDTGIVQVRTGNSDQVQQYDPATGEVSQALRTGSDAAQVYDNLLDVFSNTQVPADKGMQVADASDATGAGTMTDAGWIPAGGVGLSTTAQPDTSAHASPNTFSNYLDNQGTPLSSKQQDALAAQIDKLGLGGEGDLSFYPLPNGGALIANADGDIVGEINRSNAGELNLKATGIDANGNTVEVSQHISESGQSLSDTEYSAQYTDQNSAPYSPQTQQQASAMFNSLMAVNHWDNLNDLGKLSALVNLYNATDKLGPAFEASGNNLPGDLGAAAGWLSLAQGMHDGDALIIANAINNLSDRALDNALNEAFGNATAGEAVPYLSYALAIRNFSENPEQAVLTAAGTYIGENIGTAIGACFGPLGAVLGGVIGGALGGMLGGMFGSPPSPEGAVHFSWDNSGHIQHTIDLNEDGGGKAAAQVADSVQAMLQSVVQAHNAQNPSTNDDIAINPYLLPRIGYSGSQPWMEVIQPDGSTCRETIDNETIAQRLLQVLQDNGGIAPAWQVQTEQAKWVQTQQQIAQLQTQREALLETTTVPGEDGTASPQQSVKTGQQALHAQLGADIEQAKAHLSTLSTQFALGSGGQAFAGNTAFSLQGNAVESADFKHQTYGALVVHIGQGGSAQAQVEALANTLSDTVLKTSQVLRDVEGDGYLESTQWVAARDDHDRLQALLTIDFNADGVIDTHDILNLGGNQGDSANPTTEAALATQNAQHQHNNVQWMDVNGDGVIDQSDPAFAAIKLWIDLNQDGIQQSGEATSLQSLNIRSIDFASGAVTYDDGRRDALTATTLGADTEGVKLTQIEQVNPDGTLNTLQASDAGQVLEHEGYQGQSQISDDVGTRWVGVREHTYTQQALRTGDWVGTSEEAEHQHGGGHHAPAPNRLCHTRCPQRPHDLLRRNQKITTGERGRFTHTL